VPEYLAWAPMLVLIALLGIVPNLIFRQTDGPVHTTVTAAFQESGQPAQALPAQVPRSP
jgi:NADH:ubiquinone oxidoreductase subunit 4 (subunit M)